MHLQNNRGILPFSGAAYLIGPDQRFDGGLIDGLVLMPFTFSDQVQA